MFKMVDDILGQETLVLQVIFYQGIDLVIEYLNTCCFISA